MRYPQPHSLSILTQITLFWLISSTILSAQKPIDTFREYPTTQLPQQGFTGHLMFGVAHFKGDLVDVFAQNQFAFSVQVGYTYRNFVLTGAYFGTGDYDLKQKIQLKGRTWGDESGVGAFQLQAALGYQLALAKRWVATPFVSYNRTILQVNERLVGNKYYETPLANAESRDFGGGINVDFILKNSIMESPFRYRKRADWHALVALRLRVETNSMTSLLDNQAPLKSQLIHISLGMTTTIGKATNKVKKD